MKAEIIRNDKEQKVKFVMQIAATIIAEYDAAF